MRGAGAARLAAQRGPASAHDPRRDGGGARAAAGAARRAARDAAPAEGAGAGAATGDAPQRPPTLLAGPPEELPTRLAIGARLANLTIPSAEGPQRTLHVGGAQVRALFPVAPHHDEHALTLSTLSYGRHLHVAAAVDAAAIGGAGRLPVMLADAVEELMLATGARGSRAGGPEATIWISRMERIGFIGLGIMGSRMAAVLRRAGFEVAVWNRTRARAEAWAAEHGGTVVDTPSQLGESCDVIVSIVVDGAQVEQVLLGDGGVVEDARDGLVCVDMSTIAPAQARAIAQRLGERGVAFVDAPVTGSAPKAADGTLTIMVGAEADDLARVRPLLDAMGESIVHVGPVGHGQTVKVLTNALAAANVTRARAGAADRQARRRRGRADDRGAAEKRRRLAPGRPQGDPDADARLHAAVQARAPAEGRRPRA